MQQPPSQKRQLTADALLLLVTAIWGGTFVMVKDAVSAYPVLGFLVLRFALATLGLLAACRLRPDRGALRSLGWRGAAAGVLIGTFLFTGYALQTIGLQYTSASKAGLITGMSVVLVPLLSAVVSRRLPGAAATIGVALATLGLILLTLNPASRLTVERGDLIILGGALGFALHIVAVSVFAPRVNPLALTLVQVATVGVLCAGSALASGEVWPAPTPAVWFAAAFTGILATAVAFALQNAVQRFTTPTHTALIFTAEPVFAALFGVLLAGEALLARGIAGGLLIVAGTVASELRWSAREAADVLRALDPRVVAAPLAVCLATAAVPVWPQNLLWAGALWGLAVAAPSVVRRLTQREPLGAGGSGPAQRLERARPAALFAEALGPLAAAGLFLGTEGPRLLLLPLVALLVTVARALRGGAWRPALHVPSVTAAATALTAVAGVVAAPALLLVPLVGWARVKSGAETVGRAVWGACWGALLALVALYLSLAR